MGKQFKECVLVYRDMLRYTVRLVSGSVYVGLEHGDLACIGTAKRSGRACISSTVRADVPGNPGHLVRVLHTERTLERACIKLALSWLDCNLLDGEGKRGSET